MNQGLSTAMVAALCALSIPASADEVCSDATALKHRAEKHGLSWTMLTNDQRLFVSGLYVATPPVSARPFGDKAVMVQAKDEEGALIYFIDGTRACMPFAATPAVTKMIMDVGSGIVSHEGLEE